jgi:hypothetical protein
MYYQTDDVRIENLKPLIPPAILMEEYPLSEGGSAMVARTRSAVVDCLHGRDDRLVVVVGPCSIHDPEAALEYGRKLVAEAQRLSEDLLVIMRVYFENRAPLSVGRGSSTIPISTIPTPSTEGCAKPAACWWISPNSACPPAANSSIPSRPSSSAIW